MAIFHSTSSSMSLILLSIIFISISPLSLGLKVTDAQIKHICSKTSNPDRCFKLLKSDHRIINADAKGLAQISINLASTHVKKLLSELNSLAKATHDSRSKNIYNFCSKSYNDIIRDLEVIAKSNVKSGFVDRVKNAFEENKSCEIKLFHRGSSDRAHLKNKIEDVKFLLSIVKAMTDNLHKK
ncbi:hypothetical protein ABFS82_13G012000 [Erythranthe guttata]